VLVVVLITAVFVLSVLQYNAHTDKNQLKALLAEKNLEIECLADKTLALHGVAPEQSTKPVGQICIWTGDSWKDYEPPQAVVPQEKEPREVEEEKIKRAIRLSFSKAFGGWDESLEAHVEVLKDFLYNDANFFKNPKPEPKKSLLTPYARTCHDCENRATGARSDNPPICLKAKVGATEYRLCDKVLESLVDPTHCPEYKKKG